MWTIYCFYGYILDKVSNDIQKLYILFDFFTFIFFTFIFFTLLESEWVYVYRQSHILLLDRRCVIE